MDDKTVAAHTLGCKVNQRDTDSLLELFRRRGYRVVEFDQPADVYLINTCTVTHLGDRKSRQVIRQALRRNPSAKVVVTGCYAQRAPEEIAGIPGVSLIVGTRGRRKLVELVEGLPPPQSGTAPRLPLQLVGRCDEPDGFEELPLAYERGRTRALIKVEEGCNQFCSYCIVPYTRGPVCSRRSEDIIAEITALVEHGYREIVLTGIHTSAYGQDIKEADGKRPNLATLIESILEAVPQLKRLRVSSVEPTEVPPEIPDLMNRYPAFCRHLHLPLQSGDDQILAAMRRPYTSRQYARIVEELRCRVAGLAVTADVMVGFPGESTPQFLNTYHLVKDLALSDLHVFKYSPRPGTPAANLPHQVAPRDKEERSRLLLGLARELRRDFASRFLGEEMEVLLEQPLLPGKAAGKGGAARQPAEEKTVLWEGYTDNYLRVAVSWPADDDASGQLVRVRLKRLDSNCLLGERI